MSTTNPLLLDPSVSAINDAFKASLLANSAHNASAAFSIPAPLTFTYREVDGLKIEADVYVPVPATASSATLHGGSAASKTKYPVALFIHGGGWVGGIRTDFPRTLLYDFLDRGFVFVSIDYRLLPEVGFVEGQLDDVRAVEGWIRRGELQGELSRVNSKDTDVEIDGAEIVVIGGSAGGHLASLTVSTGPPSLACSQAKEVDMLTHHVQPRIWTTPPKAIFLLAGPTNLLTLKNPRRPLGGGKLDALVSHIPLDPSPEFMASAMFPSPVANTTPVVGLEGFLHPRNLLGLAIFVKEIIPEFLVRGIVDGRLPEKGSVPEEEIEKISMMPPIPFSSVSTFSVIVSTHRHLTNSLVPGAFFTPSFQETYPPTFQLIGDVDEAFSAAYQTHPFHDKLRAHNIPSAVTVVPESSHAFENLLKINGEGHLRYLRPGVEFVCRYVAGAKQVAGGAARND